MNKLNISLPELLNMLKIAENYFKGEKAQILRVDKISKKKAKKGSKKKLNPKTSISKKKVKKVSAKGTCYPYGKEGHWKRNCKEYLATMKLINIAKDLDIIPTNLSLNTLFSDSWILDTTYGSYLYKSL